MSSFSSSDLVRELRARKQWTQSQVLYNDILSEVNLSRIENKHQTPSPKNLSLIMDSLQMPVETFFSPYLEEQSIEHIQIREAALFYLSIINECPLAIEGLKSLIKQMENLECFSNGVNKQFLFSCKAALNEALGIDPQDTINIINEGLAITFPEYDESCFESTILIFEEINLLHTKALVYKKTGNISKAIKLLKRIILGLKNAPQDDYNKERMMAPLLLVLSQCYIEIGDYCKALKTCRSGFKYTIERNKGFHAPDFAFYTACCLYHFQIKENATSLIKQAYFGYTLLRRYNLAENMLEYAKKEFNNEFNTYGVDLLKQCIPAPTFTHGNIVKCNNIGELIATFRHEASLTLKELSKGICSLSNLAKIERGVIQGNIYHLEAIMQRLGRHIGKYFYTFLSHKEFIDKQIRDEINLRLVNREYRKAGELILKLSERKTYKSGVNKQFINLAIAELCVEKEGYCVEHIPLLKKTLSFNDNDLESGIVARTRLTYNDTIAINLIAIILCNTKNMSQGLRLFKDTKESMDRFIVDEAEKIRMYALVLYNYSKYLGLAKRYEEALQIAETGETLCVKHGRLSLLPGFVLNRACDIMEINGKKESIPYFAQAYYGSMLIRKLDNAKIIESYVLDNLGIMYD